MPRVSFTPQLQRFLDAPAAEVAGATVRAALDAIFAGNPRLRGYIVDEHGRLRTARDALCRRPRRRSIATGLSDAVDADTEIFVMQALSGGAGDTKETT